MERGEGQLFNIIHYLILFFVWLFWTSKFECQLLKKSNRKSNNTCSSTNLYSYLLHRVLIAQSSFPLTIHYHLRNPKLSSNIFFSAAAADHNILNPHNYCFRSVPIDHSFYRIDPPTSTLQTWTS